MTVRDAVIEFRDREGALYRMRATYFDSSVVRVSWRRLYHGRPKAFVKILKIRIK
jgi:hypothetical protein